MDLPFHNHLAYNRVHRRSASPLAPPTAPLCPHTQLPCGSAGCSDGLRRLAPQAKYQTDPARKRRHLKLAADIAETCYNMYSQQPTHIAPERVKEMKMDLSMTDTKEYILRPEAVEGFFYLHQLTGDPKYREWGWKVWEAFEQVRPTAASSTGLPNP